MTCRHHSAVRKEGLRDCEIRAQFPALLAANYSADAASNMRGGYTCHVRGIAEKVLGVF